VKAEVPAVKAASSAADVPPLPAPVTATFRFPLASRFRDAILVPVESFAPIAVPVPGNADPNAEDVPPAPPPAFTFTRRLPEESIWSGLAFPEVIVVGAVLNSAPTRIELAGAAAFCPAKSKTAPPFPTILVVQFPACPTFHTPDWEEGNVPPVPVTSQAVVFGVLPG
jgi:hypothetical protein